MSAYHTVLAIGINAATRNSGGCRKRWIRLRNRLNSPDGFSALCALVTLAAICGYFVRHA